MVDTKTLKIFSRKLFLVVNYTLPGILILEIFFKKGIFSHSPQNLYEFILLILWAFIFSIPYNIFDVFCIEDIFESIKKEAVKRTIITEEKSKEIDKDLKKYFKIHKKSTETNDSQIHFIAINIYILITLTVYKYLSSHYIYSSFWNFSKLIIIYFNTLIISLPIIYLLSFLARKIILKYYVNNMLKKIY